MKKTVCSILTILMISSMSLKASAFEGIVYYSRDGQIHVSAAEYSTTYSGNWFRTFSGDWYCLDEDGYLLHDCWAGNYYLGSDGSMLTNTVTPDGYVVGADGAWTGRRGHTNSGSGRDLSYASYFRKKGLLWNSHGGYYQFPEINAVPGTMTAHDDCFEIKGVTVFIPYEYATEEQARAVLADTDNAEIRAFGSGMVCQNDSGTYSIYGDDYSIFDYPVWAGSVYVRKDALLQRFNYQTGTVSEESFAAAYARRSKANDFYGIHFVVSEVDADGYIVKMHEVQWG
ncbi:MAG: hypothetical protein IJT43_10615 [Stomatobaculum sp.]|nr:hypothetical protein [Stomatobaculum sp.]